MVKGGEPGLFVIRRGAIWRFCVRRHPTCTAVSIQLPAIINKSRSRAQVGMSRGMLPISRSLRPRLDRSSASHSLFSPQFLLCSRHNAIHCYCRHAAKVNGTFSQKTRAAFDRNSDHLGYGTQWPSSNGARRTEKGQLRHIQGRRQVHWS